MLLVLKTSTSNIMYTIGGGVAGVEDFATEH